MKTNWPRIVRIVAFLFGICGAVVFVWYRSHPIIKMLGIVAVVVSAIFMRKMKNVKRVVEFHDATQISQVVIPEAGNTSDGPGVVAWVMSVIAVLAIAASYWLMRQDALNGGHQAWPADAFAGSAFFAAAVFGYIGAKLARRQ